ncbi:succinylglutamate desuccinylase/aspartoacylase family protein [Paraburkholderia antibiotica]|uniref:Succinylglutamate desuccinylase n=1 Tax=Paraburkholderia antibiotica TaxID=2728839 RepID=A0A7Y0A0X6_9BURK|nr:succinylglutamate desuccinylase/aspartoacylase family protein [Paraburkholderia antibiotica]NML34451.1 succinylglutamate desuccinylase [Paraburkholderia antibiotica]
MRIERHPLLTDSLATQRDIVSFHYGASASGLKAYLQTALHADELPGMLVLHHLRPMLAQAEQRGEIRGEIVVVPVANPAGLSQTVLHGQLGRYELRSGENFNRAYPDFATLIGDQLDDQLGDDPRLNTRLIRDAMRRHLDAIAPTTELESMRHTLIALAHDADVVFDLHCDTESIPHLYTEAPNLPRIEPLARYMQVPLVLLGTGDSGQCFDESCSQTWWRLADRYRDRFPIPPSCDAVTIELRGQADVDHELARVDADAIYQTLIGRGLIDGTPKEAPALQCKALPYSHVASPVAPCTGVIAFLKKPGARVEAGETIAQIIDPLTSVTTDVKANAGGLLFARNTLRFATRGMVLCRIAGDSPTTP